MRDVLITQKQVHRFVEQCTRFYVIGISVMKELKYKHQLNITNCSKIPLNKSPDDVEKIQLICKAPEVSLYRNGQLNILEYM